MEEKAKVESMGDFRMPTMRRLAPGEVIEAAVVSVGASDIFLDVGGKSEASIDRKELTNAEGECSVQVGDKVQAYVVSTEPSIVLSIGKARKHVNLGALEDAHDLGLPVEGRVSGVNKGGFDVDFSGVSAFCPISQIELGFCENAEVHLEEKYAFRVIEFAEGGKRVVVSRRKLLEEEQQEKAAEIESQLIEGAQFEGKVVRLQPFGAFVDIGGVQGMVHISQISHARIEHPEELLSVGQTVQVQITKMEKDPKNADRMRIGLSMRALMGDPFDEAMGTLSEGSMVDGKVIRIQPFGAFVQIVPGVDGLVHISEMAERRIANPSEVVEVGQEVQARILKIDRTSKRISLSLLGAEQASTVDMVVGVVVDTVVDNLKPFGLFVRIKGGGRNMRGLIPAEETGQSRNANLRRVFPEGTELKAQIIAIDPENGRLRLSITAVDDSQEQDDYKSYVANKPGGKVKSEEPALSGFGAALMNSLNKKK